MKMQVLFYIVGIIFIFSAVWYFTRDYLKDLPDIIKLIMLIVAIFITFVVAEIMREKEI